MGRPVAVGCLRFTYVARLPDRQPTRRDQNRAVTAVFGGILFTDTLALVVLAIVTGATEGELTVWLIAQVLLALVVLFGTVWLVLPRGSRWFFQNFSEESYFEFLFVMVAIFAAASLAEVLQLDPILGAFVAGIAVNQLIPEGGTLMNRIEFVGNAFFIPFFCCTSGCSSTRSSSSTDRRRS